MVKVSIVVVTNGGVMDRQKNGSIHLVQGILGIMMAGAFLFFLLGELLLPAENISESGACDLFQADWVRVLQEDVTTPIEVPGECDVKRGEWVIIETTLPQDRKNTWFCIRSLQQDLKIYIGDELREEYSTLDTQPFGKTSTMNYVFFEVRDSDAGQKLRIELKSDSAYAGSVSEIYTGEKAQIWQYFLKMYAPSTIVAAFMLLLSVVVFGFGVLAKIFYKRQMEITYLANAIMIASTWLLAESRLRQFFLPNSTVAMYMGFLMIMLLPYPFLAYINSVQKGRYQKVYLIIGICTLINCVVSVTLQVLNRKDFFETMGISHAIIIVFIVCMAGTILLDIRRGYLREYQEVAFGFAGVMAAGIWEICLVYINDSHNNGIPLCVGLVFLLVMAGMKTGKDMLMVEKEKQMAIAASESKAKFLANMSHEIRTPINTVIGMNEMILRESKEETIGEYARNIESASRMLLGLVNDILDFSKIEAGKLQLVESPYQTSNMLKAVVLGVENRAKQKNLEFKLEMGEDLPAVLMGDELRIRQILNNLLSNAIKYTEKGSITFGVKGLKEENGFSLLLSVADTGMGIRKEDMARLFDSFRRLELNRNRYIEGSGLGLNITKQLVDLMNGKIDVVSEYGKGSCFTVQIPQVIVEDVVLTNADTIEKQEKQTEQEEYFYAPDAKVLAVDDNAMNLSVLKGLLKRSKVQLDVCTSGTECLQMTKEKQYDLILMDHMMPEPDGVQTLHLLREDKDNVNKETKVIVLTANAIEGCAEKYLKEGFADYLSKPLEVSKLEGVLAKYLVAQTKETLQSQKISPVVIDRARGLIYCGGKEEMYQQMTQMYYKQGAEYLEKLAEYYETKNWKEYTRIAHAIKSTSLMIGLTEFAEKAKQQERAAKAEDEAFLKKEYESFAEEYKVVLAFIQKEIKE